MSSRINVNNVTANVINANVVNANVMNTDAPQDVTVTTLTANSIISDTNGPVSLLNDIIYYEPHMNGAKQFTELQKITSDSGTGFGTICFMTHIHAIITSTAGIHVYSQMDGKWQQVQLLTSYQSVIAVSGNGKHLVGRDNNNKIRVYQLNDEKTFDVRYDIDRGQSSYGTSLDISDDGNSLVAIRNVKDGGLDLYDLTDGVKRTQLNNHVDVGSIVRITGDGSNILLSDIVTHIQWGYVYTYKKNDNWSRLGYTITSPDPDIYYRFGERMEISSCGKYIAAASLSQNVVYVYWNFSHIATIKPAEISGNVNFGNSISFSKDGQYLAIGTNRSSGSPAINAVYVFYRVYNGYILINKLQTTNKKFGCSHSFSDTGDKLIIGERDGSGTVYIYELCNTMSASNIVIDSSTDWHYNFTNHASTLIKSKSVDVYNVILPKNLIDGRSITVTNTIGTSGNLTFTPDVLNYTPTAFVTGYSITVVYVGALHKWVKI